MTVVYLLLAVLVWTLGLIVYVAAHETRDQPLPGHLVASVVAVAVIAAVVVAAIHTTL